MLLHCNFVVQIRILQHPHEKKINCVCVYNNNNDFNSICINIYALTLIEISAF